MSVVADVMVVEGAAWRLMKVLRVALEDATVVLAGAAAADSCPSSSVCVCESEWARRCDGDGVERHVTVTACCGR